MIENKLLDEYSKKYAIDKFTVLREYLQIVFMNQLYKTSLNAKLVRGQLVSGKLVSGELVFKGGTAIRLIYGSPRFSEDLDFNSALSKAELKSLITTTIESSKKSIPGLYFKELDSIQGYSAKIYLENELSPMPLTIKLDFSFREETLDIVQKTIPTELPVQGYSLIQVMSEQEILAEKFRTLFQRTKGRDLYDIWYLMNKKVPLNIDFVNSKFKLIGQDFKKEKLISQIKSFDDRTLEKDLNKFLPYDQRTIVPQLKELILNNPVLRETR